MSAELLLEHLEYAAESPDAVPLVRRFILDMAVRGKLVSQNPKDESAAKLLERIEKEKRKLKKEGIIKQEESFPPIDKKDIPFQIPDGWEWMRLGNAGEWGAGTTPPRGMTEYYNGDITWIKSGDLNDTINLKGSSEKITQAALDAFSFRKNKSGDILFAMYAGTTVGKVAILGEAAVTNQAVCGCTPYNGVFNKFLFSFLLAHRKFFHDHSEGGVQSNLSRKKVVKFCFPLPPLAEQKRIVAKVDKLMALCDELEKRQNEREESRRRLVTAALHELKSPPESFAKSARFVMSHFADITARPDSIKALRKTILDMAMRGKLVPQNPKDEPAAKLLEQIAKEKKKREKDGIIRQGKPLPPIDKKDIPFQIPDGWEWVYFSNIVDFVGGKTPRRNELAYWNSNDYSWVSISDMVHGLEISKTKEHVSSYAKETVMPEISPAGTILMSFKLTIGKIARLAIPAFHNEGIISIYPHLRHIDNYLFIFLPLLSQYGAKKGAIKGMTLNRDSLSKLLISLPPLAEQKRIVAKVDKLMALCDKLESSLTATQENRRRLLVSLLRADSLD